MEIREELARLAPGVPVLAWINNYPREILGWKTSEIVFAECLEELAWEA